MKKTRVLVVVVLLGIYSCNTPSEKSQTSDKQGFNTELVLPAQFFAQTDKEMKISNGALHLMPGRSAKFSINIPETGRYKVKVFGSSDSGSIWLEDHIDNKDDRTYNITGMVALNSEGKAVFVDGSPLAKGNHPMKLHASQDEVFIDSIALELMFPHRLTPTSLTQNMEGSEWKLKWSDEFDGEGLPDSTKWSYNVGNWGWGNFEPQYYTDRKLKNARREGGNLIIQAHQNDDGHLWSSARLTTQGKVSFLYGKIEFRAKVPVGRGTWAAGWLLGDIYRDELSWPYCGEIDVLECVGYEIEDETGKGYNHATCHTPAYYFKIGNQISSVIEVENMHNEFHTYGVEWYPDRIEAFLDGEHYYTYDKTADEREWPFFQPQNIILNLAVGGGWGGAEGIDSTWNSHEFILDYVRVYELQ
ncbi:MAG TPA: hypothetical protein DDX92_05310 [Flavobacteriales bacterium]|jgi:beta-glucanase (GH16 family)|nr:hypothetical protein [Flavobacteriales bacterium]